MFLTKIVSAVCAAAALSLAAAEFPDGSSERIPVLSRIDCGNWWNPVRGRNAVIGWSGENSGASPGLYASSFALKKLGPSSLRFEIAAPDAVWMIAGVTLTASPVCFLAGDDKPIAESASVLVIQLTDVSNTGLAFGNGAKTLVTGTGNLPLLVRRGSATVELASGRPYRVTALDCDGAPYGPVPGTYREGIFRFKADTTLFPGGVMAYHLTR